LNGIVLVSTVLNFETLEFARGSDVPYILYLPSDTSTAWYHKKLPPDLQQQDVTKTLAEVRPGGGHGVRRGAGKGRRTVARRAVGRD
jgi:hypothetical protein